MARKQMMPWERYLKWWRETPSNNSRNPRAPEHIIRTAYDRYKQRWVADGPPMTDAEARIHEYNYTHGISPYRGIDRSPNVSWRNHGYDGLDGLPPGRYTGSVSSVRPLPDGNMIIDFETDPFNEDTVLVHLDGNPNNNDMSNLVRMSAQAAREFHKPEANDGFTIAEATKMGLKIATVTLFSSEKEYEFLVPGDTTIVEGTTLFAVVAPNVEGKVTTASNLTVGEIKIIKDLIDGEYDGKLRHVVVLFTAEAYNERIERQQRRERLLAKASKMAEEQHTIEKLTKLIGDSEEGKALLEQIKALE